MSNHTITHLLTRDDSAALCGADLVPYYEGMPPAEMNWDWGRENSNCEACLEEFDSENEPCCGACENERMGVTEGGIPTRSWY